MSFCRLSSAHLTLNGRFGWSSLISESNLVVIVVIPKANDTENCIKLTKTCDLTKIVRFSASLTLCVRDAFAFFSPPLPDQFNTHIDAYYSIAFRSASACNSTIHSLFIIDAFRVHPLLHLAPHLPLQKQLLLSAAPVLWQLHAGGISTRLCRLSCICNMSQSVPKSGPKRAAASFAVVMRIDDFRVAKSTICIIDKLTGHFVCSLRKHGFVSIDCTWEPSKVNKRCR